VRPFLIGPVIGKIDLEGLDAIFSLPNKRHSMWTDHAGHDRREHTGACIETAYKRRSCRIGFTRAEKWRLYGINGFAIAIRNQNQALG